MIVSFGTNTTHEKLRKFAHRMVGTVIGAVLGILTARLLAHIGGRAHVWWMLAVIVACIALGAWGMQRKYAYWVIGLVVALCQMYAFETPMSGMDGLLALRLGENALGFAIGTAAAALIIPVSTRGVRLEAVRGWRQALAELAEQVAERWREPEAPVRLRGSARAVDAALFRAQAVARPLVRMPSGLASRRDLGLGLAASATRHAKRLATAADVDVQLSPRVRAEVGRIAGRLAESLREVDAPWHRIAPAARALAADPDAARLAVALDELAALDDTLARLAESRGRPLEDDPATAPVRPRARARGILVRGEVRCAEHPDGCAGWVTVVDERGRRRARVRMCAGRFTLSGLAPGGCTLVVSGAQHPPRAEFLLVRGGPGSEQHLRMRL
ncbi:FUSC family protein [Mangrovactinospora gilvigrisea]